MPPLEASVDSSVAPDQSTILVHGEPQPVAASRDDHAVQSEFLEGVVLIRPRSAADREAFLMRYKGTVVGDDTVPEPPPALGITLTAEQRRPTQFTVRVDLSAVDIGGIGADSAKVGLTGTLKFSSTAGLATFAAVLDARAAGFVASGDFIDRRDQNYPEALFRTEERQATAGPPATFNDPLSSTAYADFGTTGNRSNVRLAWQYVAAHGVQRRTRVAIIDGGFYLDSQGMARGTDSDFPPPPGRPLQYDVDFEDPFAGDAGPGGCAANNPCYWHGTGSAGVATGIANNRRGESGTGAQVADPILLRVNGTRDQRNQAVRIAVAWGADVVSMSFSGDCDVWCRMADRDDNPFDQAVDGGSKVVFVASAGNGEGTPAVGYDVGNRFVHPCTEARVICVGALAPGGTTKIAYSNFGGHVQIFAPTNIPVMARPLSTGVDMNGNPFPLPLSQADGPPVPQTFGGTSASAPFVAGVVAMMKAVNPQLDHDAVARVLRETAIPGSGLVSRTVDAHAAVRRAAGESPIVKDFLENNDLQSSPTNLGSVPPYGAVNVNIDGRDRDYFRFDSPNGSLMTVSLQYPQGLGAISVESLESQRDACGSPTQVPGSDVPRSGGERTVIYRVPGGPLVLGLRAQDVNAYNLDITFASDTYPSDAYEANETPATAKRLSTRRTVGSGNVLYLAEDPRATVDATIHSVGDVDYYIVRGAALTNAERIFIAGYPSLQISENDSQINMEVFRLNPDNSPGERVANLNGAQCAPVPIDTRLDENARYLVKVTGSPGRYTLRNGVDGDKRRFAQLMRDRLYEVVNPGEPVVRPGRDRLLVFVADRAFDAVRSGPGVHVRLLDAAGREVAKGDVGKDGERVSLARTKAGGIYGLEVTASDPSAKGLTQTLEWDAVVATRTTGNLILNPGAEGPAFERDVAPPDWAAVNGVAVPSAIAYGDGVVLPSRDGPGPEDRGRRLFAGREDQASGIRQIVRPDRSWREAVDSDRARARLSGFLGGDLRGASGTATVTVTFVADDGRRLGGFSLPDMGPMERGDEAGLFPAQADGAVPKGTATINVDLTFTGGDVAGVERPYADNLELVLWQTGR